MTALVLYKRKKEKKKNLRHCGRRSIKHANMPILHNIYIVKSIPLYIKINCEKYIKEKKEKTRSAKSNIPKVFTLVFHEPNYKALWITR